MVRPRILRAAKVLFLARLRQAVLKKFLNMSFSFVANCELASTDNSHVTIYYSVRKDLTGFVTAALIAWKLTVINAIIIAVNPPAIKSHQLMFMR